MSQHLSGGSEIICAIGMGLFGATGVFATGLAGVLQRHDFSDDAPNVAAAKNDEQATIERNANRANRKRLSMSVALALASFTVVIGYILLFWKTGTIDRPVDDVTTNWSAFVAFGVAGAAMMVFHSYFFNLVSLLATIVAAVLWGGSIALLGLATLPHHGYKRSLLFGLAVVAQAVGALALYLGSVHMQPHGADSNPAIRVKRPFYTIEAYPVVLVAVFAFVMYDSAFFVGYWNEPSSMATLNSQWQSNLIVFFANMLFFMVNGALGLGLVDVEAFTRWMFPHTIYLNVPELAPMMMPGAGGSASF